MKEFVTKLREFQIWTVSGKVRLEFPNVLSRATSAYFLVSIKFGKYRNLLVFSMLEMAQNIFIRNTTAATITNLIAIRDGQIVTTFQYSIKEFDESGKKLHSVIKLLHKIFYKTFFFVFKGKVVFFFQYEWDILIWFFGCIFLFGFIDTKYAIHDSCIPRENKMFVSWPTTPLTCANS